MLVATRRAQRRALADLWKDARVVAGSVGGLTVRGIQSKYFEVIVNPLTALRSRAVQAIWNGEVVAESDETIKVGGRHYFPRSSLNRQFFSPSRAVTVCPTKGQASYLNIEVGDKVNAGAAWTYKRPLPAASEIRGYVAFWKGVKVRSDGSAAVGAGARLRAMFGR